VALFWAILDLVGALLPTFFHECSGWNNMVDNGRVLTILSGNLHAFPAAKLEER
jgi:hypothetical protein